MTNLSIANSITEPDCDEPMPETFYWINPNVVACRNCDYRNAYFDCGHELEHECAKPICKHTEKRRLNCEDCYEKEETCLEWVCADCGVSV